MWHVSPVVPDPAPAGTVSAATADPVVAMTAPPPSTAASTGVDGVIQQGNSSVTLDKMDPFPSSEDQLLNNCNCPLLQVVLPQVDQLCNVLPRPQTGCSLPIPAPPPQANHIQPIQR